MKNAAKPYLLAKTGADTAESERSFAEIWARPAAMRRCGRPTRRPRPRGRSATLVERLDRRGTEPFELFRSEFLESKENHEKALLRSSSRPKRHDGAARKERKGKQTALRERGVRRSRTDSKDAILAFKRCYACLQRRICLPSKYDRSALGIAKQKEIG